MQVFTANDIVEVAVRIEENGITFYNFAEKIAKTEDAKNSLPNWPRPRRPISGLLRNFYHKLNPTRRRSAISVNTPIICAITWTTTLFSPKKSWTSSSLK